MYLHIIIIKADRHTETDRQAERQTDLVAAGQTVHLHLRTCHSVAEVVEQSSRFRLKVVAQIWSSEQKRHYRTHTHTTTELQHPQPQHPEAQHPELENLKAQHPELENPEAQHSALQHQEPQDNA